MSDTTYDVFQHYGTDAERLAFTPTPASGIQPIYVWYATDTGITWLYDTSWHQVTSGGSLVSPWSQIITGRLTTESGVPVSASDRTAQGTIYFTPAIDGNAITNGQIALYSGSAVVNVAFTQLSLALTATSGKNYDVFVDYNAGTPQLALSAAWTNDTTRADALGVQSGLIIKSGTATLRWVGTIRASGANATADAAAFRFVWNAYNQVPRQMANTVETTDSWNYTTATWRQANANTANQMAYVTGSVSTMVEANVLAIHGASATINALNGIGVDSTTAVSGVRANSGLTGVQPNSSTYRGQPGLGYHFLAWLEYSVASGTTTWYGDAGDATIWQSGISGWLLA